MCSSRPYSPRRCRTSDAAERGTGGRQRVNLYKRNSNVRTIAAGRALMLNSPTRKLHSWGSELPSGHTQGGAAVVPRHRVGVGPAWDRGVRTGARGTTAAYVKGKVP
ncbi:hypothetical protein GCM10010383_09150 [Streptomyces lomondensis]|uniref:Uncharacterized protein n=1 Tax=Streptomyces lomondensis TaxID=68229 RepID=A0ABQ2WWQ5_9ACTN|nr:hypothetical protein GCM10010383_09150 [Streptomyces lomondensis]